MSSLHVCASAGWRKTGRVPNLCHTAPMASFSVPRGDDDIIITLFLTSCLLVWPPGWNVGTQPGNKQMHTLLCTVVHTQPQSHTVKVKRWHHETHRRTNLQQKLAAMCLADAQSQGRYFYFLAAAVWPRGCRINKIQEKTQQHVIYSPKL